MYINNFIGVFIQLTWSSSKFLYPSTFLLSLLSLSLHCRLPSSIYLSPHLLHPGCSDLDTYPMLSVICHTLNMCVCVSVCECVCVCVCTILTASSLLHFSQYYLTTIIFTRFQILFSLPPMQSVTGLFPWG